jgi:cephalosporin-C deacetylase-like acetyl esterase
MEGFNDAVSGHFDVADQLSRYVQFRAAPGFSDERDAKRSIDSQSEFEARRKRVRELFRSGIGGIPDRSTDLSVDTTGRIEREYSIELLTFESRPDFHVTANCYVPEGEGPHPGVLFLCGHTESPKTDPATQKACIELALNGFVVLVIDPICQGERKQYRNPETGETIVSGGGGVFAHCYAGQKCFYAGMNLARYMIADARCALDHLCDRADVDAERIGVTGASGGGVQTLYLSLVDDRIDAAAPCCAVTERQEWLKTGKRIDAEQVVYGAIPRGINFDDFVTAMAPRPVCIGAAASDEYFPIEGVRETVDRAQQIYDLYDAAENVSLVVTDTTHCAVYELGDGVFEWLCDRLGDAAYESHGSIPVLDESELRCTPRGSVREAYSDERTIEDLIRTYISEIHPDAGTKPAVEDRSGYTEALRQRLIEQFDLDRKGCDLSPRYIDRDEADGLTVEHVFFKTERNPDIVVTGVVVSTHEAVTDHPAVILYRDGTAELPERTEDIAALADEYGTVFVFDPRGVGAVRNRPIPIPTWNEDYYGIYGTEFKHAYDALLLESSLLGMRVYDVLRAVAFLRAETGSERVSFVGEGIGAYHALYAGAVAQHVDRVEVHDLGPSFFELATSREVPFHPQLTAFDVVGECDVPHLLAALGRRGVRVDRGPSDR